MGVHPHHPTHPQSHAGEGAGAPREGTRHTRSGPRASLPAISVRSPLHTPTVGGSSSKIAHRCIMEGVGSRARRVKQKMYERARMPADHNAAAGKRCHAAMHLPSPVATGATRRGWGLLLPLPTLEPRGCEVRRAHPHHITPLQSPAGKDALHVAHAQALDRAA